MAMGQQGAGFQNPEELIVGQVIIEGTADGLFIYAGTGAPGNPPVLSAVAPGTTTDPFGNAVQALLTIGLLAGVHTQFDDNGNISFVNSSGLTVIYISPADQYIGFYPLGLGNGTPIVTINGSGTNGTDPNGFAFQTGFQVWGTNGASNIELTTINGLPRAFFSVGVPEEDLNVGGTGANILADIFNPGPSEIIQFFIVGAKIGFPPASMTVTATGSGAHSVAGIALEVEVWTGQAAIPLGATSDSAAVNPPQKSITPTVVGSKIFGALNNGVNATAFTPNGITTMPVNHSDPSGSAYGTLHSAITTSLAALVLGATAPGVNCHIALAELVPLSGGPGLALDASTPAIPTPEDFSSGLQTISTAAFTPPPGSIVVAMVPANYDGSGNPIVATVSGGGLSWTKVADDGDAIATVWFAVVPVTPSSNAYIALNGEAKDGSVPAGGTLHYNDGTIDHSLLIWGQSGVQVESMLPGDGNLYQTERLTIVASSDTLINVVAPGIQITTTIELGVGTYFFDCQIRGIPNVNGGAMQLEFGGNTSVATITIECVELIEGTPGTLGNIGAINNFAVVFQGAAYTAGKTRTIQMRGTIVCTVAGTFGIFASTSIAADTWTFKQLGSFMNMYPIGS